MSTTCSAFARTTSDRPSRPLSLTGLSSQSSTQNPVNTGSPVSHLCVWGGGLGYHTIDSLFDVIQDAIADEADQLTVSYNSEFGYPTNVEIDRMINAIDDEYTFTASAYSPR